MFNFFQKKNQEPEPGKQYVGRAFGPFVLAIPEDWACVNDNGTLRANKNDQIRLNISLRDMSQAANYTLDALFETVKAGYFDSDMNWGAYSSVTKKDDLIYQTLEYLDDPRLVIAVVEKVVQGKQLALVLSFAGNSGKEIETHFQTFTDVLENVEVLG
jgi:hypothetical protein